MIEAVVDSEHYIERSMIEPSSVRDRRPLARSERGYIQGESYREKFTVDMSERPAKMGLTHSRRGDCKKSYDEALAATDPIGKDEFDGIVEAHVVGLLRAHNWREESDIKLNHSGMSRSGQDRQNSVRGKTSLFSPQILPRTVVHSHEADDCRQIRLLPHRSDHSVAAGVERSAWEREFSWDNCSKY